MITSMGRVRNKVLISRMAKLPVSIAPAGTTAHGASPLYCIPLTLTLKLTLALSYPNANYGYMLNTTP